MPKVATVETESLIEVATHTVGVDRLIPNRDRRPGEMLYARWAICEISKGLAGALPGSTDGWF